MVYNRDAAVRYALQYALTPNPAYAFYPGDDCTNFISQCLQAGGARNDFNRAYPWWHLGGRTSVCWSVAHSLFWYIRTRSEKKRFGIKAETYYLDDQDDYARQIRGKVVLGDLIQYRNSQGRIQHSTMITGFDPQSGEPLVSQHTFEGRNVTWRKPFLQVIFHHITGIN
ncbi:MAG: amidase domain-containing protein [Christensenellales bacterium]